MKQGIGSFQMRHKALLLSIAALAALVALIFLQSDFDLSIDHPIGNQTLEMKIGESQNLNLTISGGMGFKILGATPLGKICLDFVNVPAGLNASVYPNEGCPLFHSNITIHVEDNATEGSKRIVLRGIGPLGKAKTLDLNLRIAESRYFELEGDAANITIQQNKTGAIPVHIIRDQDYNETISFKALDLPAGVEPIFDPVSSLPGTALSTLRLRVNPEVRIGTYNFSVLGTGADNMTAGCNLSLKIEPDKYFSISAIPSIIKIEKGNSTVSSIELISVNNYTGKVKISITKYPKGIIAANLEKLTADLSSSSPKSQSSLKLQISNDAVLGESYYVTVNGLGQDGCSVNSSIMVIIEGSGGSFKIEPQFRSLQLKPGETKSSEIIIEGNNGYEGTITLSVSDVPGITANIDPKVLPIDGQNSIARSELRVHAQAESDFAIKSDMIIRGFDAKQNSDECKIAISVRTEPSVIKPSVIEPPITKPPVIKLTTTQDISPENGMPSIKNLSPSVNPIYSDQIVKFLAEARDPDNDPLNYRFLLNGRTISDWSEKNTAEISMMAGENEIEVQVIDGLHNGRDMYDDNKIIKITAYPEVPVDPSYEYTTLDEFFNEIVGKDFNYNNIPIEGASASTRDRWYRNEPSSANYVGEYEIRKELFYRKSDYTIKLVLDNMSKPIDVIFVQDSNIVSEVPSGFVEQAMRKLSNL
jgi:hypothetical protein